MKKYIVIGIVAVALLILMWKMPLGSRENTAPLIQEVSYVCASGRTINAAFYGVSGQLGSVRIHLDDDRSFTLPQVVAASGARYANEDESFVFWTKGNNVTITDRGKEGKYVDCAIEGSVSTLDLSERYASTTLGFSISYPADYTVDDTYSYTLFGPGKSIPGVRFGISPRRAEGTNLSSDTYISVERHELSSSQTCSASLFVDNSTVKAEDIVEKGTPYSFIQSVGAGAGNRYEETVYAIPGSVPCVAVRYFVHYGVLENYPEGAVQDFNKKALIDGFDQMRRTLVLDK